MKVSIDAIQRGIIQYADTVIGVQLPLIQQLGFGSLVALAVRQLPNQLNHPMIKTLGVVDEDGKIDIDLLYEVLKERFPKKGGDVQLPVIGNVTFSPADLDHLYELIKGGA